MDIRIQILEGKSTGEFSLSINDKLFGKSDSFGFNVVATFFIRRSDIKELFNN